jgi:hypothetical protein
LDAWREVAPKGVLVCYEVAQARSARGRRVRHAGVSLLQRVYGLPADHHGEYEPELFASLPLAGRMCPRALLDTASEAGWRSPRIERLRDVEWARRMAGPPLLGALRAIPHFAMVARA